MTFKETGQHAYEAYARAKGNHDGEIIMKTWRELGPFEKQAWRDAAHAAIKWGWLNRHSESSPPAPQ